MTDGNIKGYTSDHSAQGSERAVYVALSDDDTSAEIDPRLDLKSYSEGEFAWGSTSDAALQLGLAMLADYYDDEIATKHHEKFTEQVVATMHQDAPLWIPANQIEDAIQEFAIRAESGDNRIGENGQVDSVTVVPGDERESVTTGIAGTHQFPDVEFVAVDAGRLHVWYEDTHYLGAGTANEVEAGDVFYFPKGLIGEGPPLVTTVEELSESRSESSEFPDAVLDVDDRINVGFLIGAPMGMGQLSPPELLIQQ